MIVSGWNPSCISCWYLWDFQVRHHAWPFNRATTTCHVVYSWSRNIPICWTWHLHQSSKSRKRSCNRYSQQPVMKQNINTVKPFIFSDFTFPPYIMHIPFGSSWMPIKALLNCNGFYVSCSLYFPSSALCFFILTKEILSLHCSTSENLIEYEAM